MTNLEKLKARKIRRTVVYTVTAVVFISTFIGILYGMKPMILPFILGAFLAYLFKPLINYRGSKVKKYLRSAAILCTTGLFIYLGVSIAKQSIPNEREKLILKVRLQYRLNDRYLSWLGLKDKGTGNIIHKMWGTELEALRVKVGTSLRLTQDEEKQFIEYYQNANEKNPMDEKYYQYYLANRKSNTVDIEKLKTIAKAAGNTAMPTDAPKEGSQLGNILHRLSHWIIFPLAFMFILLDNGQIIHFFMRLIPNRYFELAYNVLDRVDVALGKYIRGTMIECSLVGLTLLTGFFLCGVELKVAAVIGVIGGLTNAIPFVGTFIACIIGAAYSLIAEDISPIIPFINENNLMLAVVGVVMVAHLLDNAIFQPLVVGSAVNIHPLVVVLGVFGGSLMFGFAGLIFAIPTIVIIKVVTETLFRGLKDYRII